MPTSPADLLRSAIAAANDGNIEAALACWADDATCSVEPAAFAGATHFAGRAQLRRLVEHLIAERTRTEVAEVDSMDERGRLVARVRTTLPSLQRLSINGLDGRLEAVVRDGLIQSASLAFDARSAQLLEAARSSQTASAQPPLASDPFDGALADGPEGEVVPHQSSG